jgi:hypothetical protein
MKFFVKALLDRSPMRVYEESIAKDEQEGSDLNQKTVSRSLPVIALLLIGLLAACNLSNTGRPRVTTPTALPGQGSEATAIPATPTRLPVGITLTPLSSSVVSVEQVTGYHGIDLPRPGSTAVVFVGNDRLDIHSNPGDQYGVVTTLSSFDQVEVVAGPQRAGTKTWWKIRFRGIEGWVAGLGEKAYQTLVPIGDFRFCSDVPPVAGGEAEVFSLDGALSLFSAPTTTAPILTEMPVHTRVGITSGSQSVGQNIWHGVRYVDESGRAWNGFAVGRSGNFCTLHPVS